MCVSHCRLQLLRDKATPYPPPPRRGWAARQRRAASECGRGHRIPFPPGGHVPSQSEGLFLRCEPGPSLPSPSGVPSSARRRHPESEVTRTDASLRGDGLGAAGTARGQHPVASRPRAGRGGASGIASAAGVQLVRPTSKLNQTRCAKSKKAARPTA